MATQDLGVVVNLQKRKQQSNKDEGKMKQKNDSKDVSRRSKIVVLHVNSALTLTLT